MFWVFNYKYQVMKKVIVGIYEVIELEDKNRRPIFDFFKDKTCAIIRVNSEAEQIIEVPEKIAGMKVVEIGYKAFINQNGITSIKLPDTIQLIGMEAFAGCQKLTTINLPSGLIEIGQKTFKDCVSLGKIIIPVGVKSIGCEAFCNCIKLKSIELPENYNELGARCFVGCSSLENVNIGNVKSVGKELFKDCTSLKRVKWSDSTYELGSSTFEGCENLEVFEVGDLLKRVGKRAFYRCKSLKDINIPNLEVIDELSFSKTNIKKSLGAEAGVGAYKDCKELEEFIYEGESVPAEVCDGCDKLKHIRIGRKVQIIGVKAFRNCISLEEIVIPKNINDIGSEAFSGCTAIKMVELDTNSIEKMGSHVFENEWLEKLGLVEETGDCSK